MANKSWIIRGEICFALCCLIKGIVRLKVKSSLFVSSMIYMDDFVVPIELIKLSVILLHTGIKKD